MILVPAIASLLAVLVGRWQQAIRAEAADGDYVLPIDRRPGSPGLVRFTAVTAILASTAAAGIAVYAGKDQSVNSARALHAAIVTALATGLPLAGYYAIASWLRSRAIVFTGWLLSLFPLYVYFLLVVLTVAHLANCAPNASDCPI